MTTGTGSILPIAVVMATYNGARYLQQQLESLWRQTRQDFELVVRDDGSSDATLDILSRAAAERPGRLRLIVDDRRRLGPKASFGVLLQHTEARWIAFCDQDDVWLPEKLERQVSAIQRLERDGTVPALCCSDAAVTDEELRITAPSYFAKHDLRLADGRDLSLPRLLFRNYAIGTTTMINAALATHCRPLPPEAIMHDWWCALVATAIGRTTVLPQALVRYRQHGGNAVGSRRRGVPRSYDQFVEYVKLAQGNSARCVQQAQALHRIASATPLADAAAAVLDRYASFASQSFIERALTVLRTRAFKPGIALNGLHLYACMTAPL